MHLNNRKITDKTVDKMPEAKFIRRSRSPLRFPVLTVDKKDGAKWFCAELRKLNKKKENSVSLTCCRQ